MLVQLNDNSCVLFGAHNMNHMLLTVPKYPNILPATKLMEITVGYISCVELTPDCVSPKHIAAYMKS